jgi:TonB-linked SusC/RagA family outer membrane protein
MKDRFQVINGIVRVTKGLLTFVLLLTVTAFVYAGSPDVLRENRLTTQQAITGRVTGEDGDPIPGVNVLLKNSSVGTVTDVNGEYTLSVSELVGTIVFSYIGYVTHEESVNGRTSINVTLKEDITKLDEVVVVGYGTEERINVIGSVSQITSEDITNRPVSSLSNSLTGKMSGVTVIQRAGKPGETNSTIRIRGVGSFGAVPEPLILVDGIPGSLNEINPNDIESISVLKDASSAAIYGARSANGVILVTTKNGKEGGIKVAYSGYYGISTPTEFPDLANSWEYAEMFNIASGTEAYSSEEIAKYRAQNDPDNYPNTNFLKETFSRNGIQTGHDVSLTGGQNSNRYFMSVGYLNEKGLVVKNDYERYNFRMNLDSELSKNLKLTTRLSGSFEEMNEPQTTANKEVGYLSAIVSHAVRYPSIYLGRASNDDFGPGPESAGTPVSWLASKSYRKRPTTKAGVNTRLQWNVTNDLMLSAIGGYNFGLREERSYRASQILSPSLKFPLATLDQSRDKTTYKTMQFLAEYMKTFEKHDMKVLAGYSFENEINETFGGSRQNFPSNDYTVMSMGGVDNQEVYGNDAEWAIQSFFGRFKYQFNEKYLFEATIRRDGSSRFPKNRKYGSFPSFAVGWRINEEPFFSENFSWVSNLKLKGSWGKLGNQNIGNYPYQSTLASGWNYPFGTGMSTGAVYNSYRDPSIHWETTETTDVGLETGFLNDKLTFNVTYFNRHTYDILYTPASSVSAVLGVGISETNTGEVRNRGWEFEGGYRDQIGDFSFGIQGNLSVINNEVVTLGLGNVQQPNGLIGNGTDLFVGFPMELYYGYKSDGVFISEEDIDSWSDQTRVNAKPVPGDIRYVDISGPDGVPDGQVDATYDRTFIGSRIPKYNFSITLTAKYRNFDFSAFLQGVSKVQGRLDSYVGYAFYNLGTIQRWQMEGRFDPANPQRYPEYPRLELVPNGGTPNTVLSDFWILNSSYLRLKNVQVGYTLPSGLLSSVRIDQLRVYFSGENMFSVNQYRKGWDPEINTGGGYYPILSTFVFGVNAKF